MRSENDEGGDKRKEMTIVIIKQHYNSKYWLKHLNLGIQ
jgi:hypothetical protein